MSPNIKEIVRAVTPPIFLSAAKTMVSRRDRKISLQESPGEKGAEWYDGTFERNDRWMSHYTTSGYYFLWTVILDRIQRQGVHSILEIGCGSGQLACLIRDREVENYHGFDFSPLRLAQAKKVCKEFKFSVEDAFETNLFTTYDYDCIVCTEFLEHVEGDIEVLRRIRPGTTFFGTVPNFPFTSHVRHFDGEADVSARYGQCFNDLSVATILANDRGKKFFLLEGTIA